MGDTLEGRPFSGLTSTKEIPAYCERAQDSPAADARRAGLPPTQPTPRNLPPWLTTGPAAWASSGLPGDLDVSGFGGFHRIPVRSALIRPHFRLSVVTGSCEVPRCCSNSSERHAHSPGSGARTAGADTDPLRVRGAGRWRPPSPRIRSGRAFFGEWLLGCLEVEGELRASCLQPSGSVQAQTSGGALPAERPRAPLGRSGARGRLCAGGGRLSSPLKGEQE